MSLRDKGHEVVQYAQTSEYIKHHSEVKIKHLSILKVILSFKTLKMITEIVLFIVTGYLIYRYLQPKRPKNFPPGPAAYPFVGSSIAIGKLGKTAHEAFWNLGKIYGPITGTFLGPIKVVIINGYEATKAFYARNEFDNRPYIFTIAFNNRQLGVFFSNGRLWQEQRRFTIRHLRDFGFGKSSMEGLIHEEALDCIESLKKAIKEAGPSQVMRIDDKFNVSVINILWAIMGGKRYKHGDAEFEELLNAIQRSLQAGNPGGNFINVYPFLRHFPYFKQQFKELVSGNEALRVMLKKTIDEHRRTLTPEEPRDLIDVYLKAIEENKNDPESTFSEDQLIQTCADLYGAGAHPTSSAIAFAVLHMVRNPEIQRKVHEELDNVLGRDTLPSYEDRTKLPYTFAVVTESFRMSPVGPVSVPHFNYEDVEFMGYNIPKETFALVNFTSTNMDEKYWGDPHNFRPERFLDADGKFIKAHAEHVFGFGFGKRQCLGEPLARISVFDLFTAIMQHFKLEVPEGESLPTIQPMEGFSVAPYPFSAKVTVRF